MKKIININLAGRVIPIEDSAYESLQQYIESLRRYFAAEEGRDEIINDIESRIAELMSEKIRKGASSVTDQDAEEIISSMGRVEDFEAVDADTETRTNTQQGAATENVYQAEPRKSKRLYRDLSDKFLGGVCSGIANYLNVDPAMIRLLYAILAFGSFGFGFLLYIFLWIFLPGKDLETYIGKRLFRNPDDMIIGGVCGGLAAYFNWNSRTVRAIFGAPLILIFIFSLLNALFSLGRFEANPFDVVFGSISSTFIFAYIVLWIVLPLANSPFEKMEMRGEKVDVNRIRQNVQQNMSEFETRAKAFGEEATAAANRLGEKAKEFANTKGRAFAREAKPAASGIGHAIGVIIKAILLFILGSIALSMFVGLMVLVFGGGTVLWPLKQALLDFVLDGFWQKFFFWGTMIFFIAVPIVAFITWMIRRIMRVRSQKSYLGWVFGGLWTLGWISIIMFATLLMKDFRTQRESQIEIPVNQPASGKMLITMNEPAIRYKDDLFFTDADNRGWDFTEDSLKMANIHLEFDASRDSNYYVSVIKQSRGRDYNHAFNLANRISYHASSVDSTLDLGSGLAIARSDKFRGQEVTVVISVPVGKKIEFDESVAEKMNNYHVSVRRSRRGVRVRSENIWVFGYRTGVEYTMSATGDLQSEDDLKRKEEERQEQQLEDEMTDERRVQPDTTNAARKDSINKVLIEEKRKREEADRRIKELENLKNRRTGYAPNKQKGDQFLFLPSVFI